MTEAPDRRIMRLCPRIGLLLGGAVLLAVSGAARSEEAPVDLELVLAVDISGSIDRDEAALQRQGYLAALVHPEVIGAIRSGPLGRIAITYVEWAGERSQRTVVDWTVIEDERSAASFAAALAERPPGMERWTSISGAIDFVLPMFQANGFAGARRVIDISGDGYNNSGRAVAAARDDAVGQSVTINGLPILNDRSGPGGWPAAIDLDRYYETDVIGGPGAFIVVAGNFEAFAEAILTKLVLEIAGLPPATRLTETDR